MNFFKSRKPHSFKDDEKSPRRLKARKGSNVHVDAASDSSADNVPTTKLKSASAMASASTSAHNITEMKASPKSFEQLKLTPEHTVPQCLVTLDADIRPMPEAFELKHTPPLTDFDLPDECKAEGFLDSAEKELNSNTFRHIDEHALRIAKQDFQSFRELMWALIYGPEISDDLEKARAIYVWLCARELNDRWKFSEIAPGTPEEVLENRSTYAQAFALVCSYAFVKVAIITGYAKGAEYEPGMRFIGRHGAHSWNAVLIRNKWYLIDCHWSSRRVKERGSSQTTLEIDTFYFLPMPLQMVYSHYPEKPLWQLLQRPLSLSEFESLPPIKSTFFKYGLELDSHHTGVIEVEKPELDLTLRVKKCGESVGFTFTLSNDIGHEQTAQLSQYGIHEFRGNTVWFHFRLPHTTTYRLIIYAKNVQPFSAPSRTDVEDANKEVYSSVCEFKIVSAIKPEKKIFPYPPCQNACYGPNELSSRFQLVSLQKNCLINATNGNAEIRFRLPKFLRFMPKLRTHVPTVDEHCLDRCCILRVVDLELRITVLCPQKGEYGLEIYGNDPSVDGNTLYHVWQFLVVSDSASSSAKKAPRLATGNVGAQSKFALHGISLLTFSDPYIQTRCNEHNIQFGLRQMLRSTVQLLYCEGEKEPEDMTSWMLQQSSEKETKLIFLVRLPKPGFYKLQLFSLPVNDPQESLPNVYNYLIEVLEPVGQHMRPLCHFPKQMSIWKEGCYLFEPLDGNLSGVTYAKESILFKIQAPRAQVCCIVIGDEWIPMDSNGDALWSAYVNLNESRLKGGTIKICGNYGSYKASYLTLLEYNLRSDASA